jgi:SNF2 family DNA or RNA helicase
VELFTAFREVHSPYWHTRRQQIAQAFLNQFVRQNYAEIEEIPWEEHIVPVQLPAAERAIYLELEHYLQALDYNVQKSRAKVDNDRDRRQQEALGDSKTAEEALIKRCSHFDLDNSRRDEENAVQACDVIVDDRKKQLHSCREDIRRSLKDALSRYKEIPKGEWQEKGGSKSNDKRPRDVFMEFVEQCRSVGVGDPDANHDIRVLLDEAFANGKAFKVTYADGSVANPVISKPIVKPVVVKEKTKDKGKKDQKDDSEDYTLDTFEKIDQLKSKVIYLRGLVRKELAGRHRSLRYFTVVRDLQKSAVEKTAIDVSCPGCKKPQLEASEIAVLSSCGHKGCYDCLEQAARLTKCLTEGCAAATRALAVVRADSLGSEDKHDGIGRHHGKKLEKIVELIKHRIPKQEKILLFVQFPDLMEKVATILSESGIKFFKISGTASKQSATVEAFQQDEAKDGTRVMLLNVTAESSSGA